MVHGTEMTTCPACLKRFLLFIAKCEGRVSNCTKSLFAGRYNSFATRRGLGRVKEGFRFFASSSVSPQNTPALRAWIYGL